MLKLNAQVTVDMPTVFDNLSWIHTALTTNTLSAEDKKILFNQAKVAFELNAKKIAQEAFELGVKFGKNFN